MGHGVTAYLASCHDGPGYEAAAGTSYPRTGPLAGMEAPDEPVGGHGMGEHFPRSGRSCQGMLPVANRTRCSRLEPADPMVLRTCS